MHLDELISHAALPRYERYHYEHSGQTYLHNTAKCVMCNMHLCLWFISNPVGDGKGLDYYSLIGVFRLCAGDDRLDELPVRGVHAELRGFLRRRARLHTLVDHCRAILAGSAAECDGDRRAS